MANKFNLTELLNQRSKEAAQSEKEMPDAEDTIEKKEKMYIDIYDIAPSQENFYDVETGIEELKQSIELVGLIEPLVVTPIKVNPGDVIPCDGKQKYRLISGHRRRLAIRRLVNEGKERFRMVECSVRDTQESDEDRIMNRLMMIMANGYRDKTDWERMTETIETERLVLELKEKMDIAGRTRDLLAEILKSTPTQIARYKAISKNLEWSLLEKFKENKIGVSAAYEASGLKHKYQEKAVEILEQNGELQLGDIKKLKAEEKEHEQIPGQQSISIYKQIEEQKEIDNQIMEQKDRKNEKTDPEEDATDPTQSEQEKAIVEEKMEPEQETMKPTRMSGTNQQRKMIDMEELILDLKEKIDDKNVQETLEFFGVYDIIRSQKVYKNFPVKVIHTGYNNSIGTKIGECPICNRLLRECDNNYCPECGKKLEW